MYYSQEVINVVDDMYVYGGKVNDFLDVWDMIKDKREYFFNDFDMVVDKQTFKMFYEKCITDVCIVRNSFGDIIYATWIIPSGYKSFFYCVASKYGDTNISLSKRLQPIVVDFYKSKYKITRLDALINAKNRISRIVARIIGFKCLGKIPKYTRINGIDTDFFLYYMEV